MLVSIERFVMKHLLFILLGAVLIWGLPVSAQSAEFYVCRDPRYETVRLEFHNIPTDWLDPDGVGIWILADGFGMYDNTIVVDAIVEGSIQMNNPDVYPGLAIIGKSDYTAEMRGDSDSPPCDPALSPVQEAEVTPEPTPEPTPDPAPAAAVEACAYMAINSGTGLKYCYTPLAHGVVPPITN